MLCDCHTPRKSRVKKLLLSKTRECINTCRVELAAMVPRGFAAAVTEGDFKCLIRLVDYFYGTLLLMVVADCWPDSVLVGI